MAIRFLLKCLAITLLVLSAHAAGAQTAPTPSQILSQPQFVNGKGLADAVQSLMGDKSATTLAAIINFAKTANEDQRKAIGQGLALAAKAAAAGGDPQFVNTIQQAIATSGLPELQKSYADAGGDTGTASTGGGGGGGGGGPTGVGPPTGGANAGVGPNGITLPTTQTTGLLVTGGLGGGGFSQIQNPSPR
jgi:hypothetical protein